MHFDIASLITILSGALAIWIGARIKASEVSNKWIPWITLAISFLTQIANTIGVQPAMAALADSVSINAPAVVHHSFWHIAISILGKTILQALGVTGFVSFGKNAVLGQVSEAKSYFRAFR